jgi:hypothetical protein
VDGESLARGSGRQLHEMTIREGCNLAYFHVIKDMREEDRAARMAGHQFDMPLDERIQRFEEKIGLRPDHEELALWMHRNVMLPAQGYTPEQIAGMFGEEAASDLPPGVSEADRWRFEDREENGLADFKGNPWELPGMGALRRQQADRDREAAAEAARDVL